MTSLNEMIACFPGLALRKSENIGPNGRDAQQGWGSSPARLLEEFASEESSRGIRLSAGVILSVWKGTPISLSSVFDWDQNHRQGFVRFWSLLLDVPGTSAPGLPSLEEIKAWTPELINRWKAAKHEDLERVLKVFVLGSLDDFVPAYAREYNGVRGPKGDPCILCNRPVGGGSWILWDITMNTIWRRDTPDWVVKHYDGEGPAVWPIGPECYANLKKVLPDA